LIAGSAGSKVGTRAAYQSLVTMLVFVMTAVPAVIAGVPVVINIHHLFFDEDFPGHYIGGCRLVAAGRNGGTCGTAKGATDDRATLAAQGRTHASPGAATNGPPDDCLSIGSKGGRREGGQSDENEYLLAYHDDPLK
jgi:hypothetical protein